VAENLFLAPGEGDKPAAETESEAPETQTLPPLPDAMRLLGG
jgi:hypothetical protein